MIAPEASQALVSGRSSPAPTEEEQGRWASLKDERRAAQAALHLAEQVASRIAMAFLAPTGRSLESDFDHLPERLTRGCEIRTVCDRAKGTISLIVEARDGSTCILQKEAPKTASWPMKAPGRRARCR